MNEETADINQTVGKIIKAKFFSQEEQKLLADLLAREGVSEVFFQKVKEMFEMAVKRAAQKGQPIIANFDGQATAAEQEMEEKNSVLLAELKNKLAQVPDDDFEQRSRLLQEHHQAVMAQYSALEQKIRDIGAKILAEQIKSTE